MANYIDTRPAEVPISHYAGDTLSFEIWFDGWLPPEGSAWSAQVRKSRTDTEIAATFSIAVEDYGTDPNVGEVLGATLTLYGEASSLLVGSAERWDGYWDVQVSQAGLDPVITLSHGDIAFHKDVTRAEGQP